MRSAECGVRVNKRDQIVKRDCAKYIYFAPFQCVNLSMYIINYSTLSDKYVTSGRERS